jgi:oligopeptide transport system substrate-binding protein
MLADVNRERLATRIKLSSLDKGQTQELLATLFAEEINTDFLDGVYRETEGNPFFIEEVCKALVDSGKLYYEGGHWQRPDDIEDLEIPQGVRLAIQSRIGKLSSEEQHTLQLAALLGREFEYEMLDKVSDLDEDELIGTLEKAEEAQLIEEVQQTILVVSPSFAFTHALIHSTLLSDLSTLRRQRLQRQVAIALEENYPDRLEELAPLLGRYFAEAGDGEKGVKYLLLTGDAARVVFAYDEAIEAYEHALLFLVELGDHERAARTHMKLGLTYHNIFDFESSRKAYEQGFAQWQLAGGREATDDKSVEPAPHPFRGLFGGPPTSLDPSQSYDAFSGWCINQFFSGLVQLTAEDELLPDMAQSWEVLEEGRKYIFHLRDDVVWSDDTPVTAADFEYAWKRTLHPINEKGLFEILFDINNAKEYKEGLLDDPGAVGVKAVDEYTLVVDLESPSNCFLQILASPISKPVPSHVVGRLGESWSEPENIVTNGPFRLKSLIPKKELIFERYDAYHGRFGGNITLCELVNVSDQEAVEMYERDELDIIYPFAYQSISDGKRMIQLHPDEYISLPDPSTQYLAFDATKPPFDDPRVRQALVLATDRSTVINQIAQGITFPASGGMVPPGVVGHVPGIALPFDPELARARLAEGGYPEGSGLPTIEVSAVDYRFAREVIVHLAAQWEEILGLRLSIQYVDIEPLVEHLEATRPNMWMMGWSADYPDPDSFLRYATWLSHSGWHNEKYEILVQEARRITNQERRMGLYREAEEILANEAPIMPIMYGRQEVLIKPWLPGLPASVISGNILKDIIIEPH